MYNKYIKAKIISREQAKKFGLLTSSDFFKNGMGTSFLISASGKIGKERAEKVFIQNPHTGEEHILLDKGKIFEFEGFKNQKEIPDSKIEKINKLRAK